MPHETNTKTCEVQPTFPSLAALCFGFTIIENSGKNEGLKISKFLSKFIPNAPMAFGANFSSISH